jgi:glycosyltransferase involved in cell wall biosynthesis
MRILHLTGGFPPDQPGGAYAYVSWLHGELTARGVRSAVLTRDHWWRTTGPTRVSGDIVRVPGSSTYNWDQHWAARSRLADPAWTARATVEIDRIAPDVIHVHSVVGLPGDLLGGLVAPVVVTHHDYGLVCPRFVLQRPLGGTCPTAEGGRACRACCWEGPETVLEALARGRDAVAQHSALRPPRPSLRWAGRRRGDDVASIAGVAYVARYDIGLMLARRAAANLVPSRAAAAALKRATDGALDAEVLPNPMLHEGLARHPRISHEGFEVAFLGSDVELKGLPVLVAAIAHLPGVRLRVLGRIDATAERALRRRLGDQVAGVHRDYRPADLPELLASSDVVAVPSRWEETGSPMVTTETQALGIPTIASDLGGMTDAVDHEVNGLLVPAGSSEALRGAIERLRDDPVLLARLGAATGPRAPAADEHLGRLLELYDGAVG